MEKREVVLEFEPAHDGVGNRYYVAKLPENKEVAEKIKEAVNKYHASKTRTNNVLVWIKDDKIEVRHEFGDVTDEDLKTTVKLLQRMLKEPITKKFTLHVPVEA